jgi:alkylmercury lyase
MPTALSLDELAQQLVQILPKHTELEQRIGVALMRRLAKGDPVELANLAADLDLSEDRVADTLDGMPGVYRDDEERVIGYFGLTIIEMGNHRIHVDNRELSAWCAWDTLFIPEILGRAVKVTSLSPDESYPISLTASPEGPSEVTPPDTVVTFVPPTADFVHNTIATFCHYIHFFPSREAAQDWIAKHPDTFVVPIDDAYRLGGVLTQAAFGAVIPPRAQ